MKNETRCVGVMLVLLVTGCPGEPKKTSVDSGVSADSGAGDAGVFDAGAVADGGSFEDAGFMVDAGAAFDAGAEADSGVFDAGAFDAGCMQLETVDGGCLALVFANVCSLPRLTVIHSGEPTDDDAGSMMGAAIQANCPAGLMLRTVNGQDGGVLDAVGAPVVTRDDALICGGGSFSQPHVNWLETTAAVSPVYDSSTLTQVSYTRRDDGGVIFTDVPSNLGPELDYFLIELVRTRPAGPVTVVGYGSFEPGTVAAAWYFANSIMPMHGAINSGWFVVRWVDLNHDGLPNEMSEFTVLGSGP